MEDILLQYISSVVSKAASTASDTLKQRVDERDVLFVVSVCTTAAVMSVCTTAFVMSVWMHYK